LRFKEKVIEIYGFEVELSENDVYKNISKNLQTNFASKNFAHF
jgi:hypothetical protein